MFKRLFGRERQSNQAIIAAIYEKIVAAARAPALYADCAAPDTPLGRFEMLALHTFLVLQRLQDQPHPARAVAQDLTDLFFADVENSLRELGIGDLGIPKRMKKLARMFYGRALSYGRALEVEDAAILAEALVRNVRPGAARDAAADRMARHAIAVHRSLQEQQLSLLLQGQIAFPRPAFPEVVP